MSWDTLQSLTGKKKNISFARPQVPISSNPLKKKKRQDTICAKENQATQWQSFHLETVFFPNDFSRIYGAHPPYALLMPY